MNALARFRAEKDAYFRESPDSPVQDTGFQGAAFSGLHYYPESAAYIVTPLPERFGGREVVLLETSTGDEQTYFRAARATFELGGQPCALMLYQPTFETGGERFFVPFRDATSGQETYGVGRYLEADLLSDGRVLLDFNYAYHPFCAYSPRYRCPLPPVENRLSVPVYAGEKL
jgi:uncharacterized protein (DUF1684 family)